MSVRVGCNILLTGLPRSGTNLSCALLNKVEQTVALAEPMDVGGLGRAGGRAEAMWLIERFLQEQRHSLLTRGVAFTRHLAGEVQDNYFASPAEADGLRTSRSDRGLIAFDKRLNPDFRLVIKHPAAFTALLPELAENFPCFALIRNPLSVLASWSSNRIPVHEGHAPAAENLDSRLKARLAGIAERPKRQLFLLSWFFAQFRDALPDSQLIRYENLIQSNGSALQVIAPSAATLNVPLASRNANALYNWRQHGELVKRLLDSDGAYWHFYQRGEVEQLFNDAVAAG